MAFASYNSPFGPLALFEEDGALVAVDWGWPGDGPTDPPTGILARLMDQLDLYFSGEPVCFDIPLNPHGTAFQKRVWQALSHIPHGQTRTYGQLALQLGTAPRALGGACGRNPIPIIIPCHRVLASNGSLGGYSGLDGLETKQALLDLEQRDKG